MIIDVSSDDEDDNNNQPDPVMIIDVSSDEEDDGDQQEDEVIIDVSSDEEDDGQQDEEVEEVDNDDQRGEEVDVDNNQNQQQVDNHEGVDNNQNQQGGPIYNHWPFPDELLILNTLAAYRRRKSSGDKKMSNQDLYNAINGDLKRDNATVEDLAKKVSALKAKFEKAVDDGPGHSARDQRLYELSKLVWASGRIVL